MTLNETMKFSAVVPKTIYKEIDELVWAVDNLMQGLSVKSLEKNRLALENVSLKKKCVRNAVFWLSVLQALE